MPPSGRSSTAEPPPHDDSFLDTLPARQVMAFRNYKYSPAFLTSCPHQFLDNRWVDVPAIKDFITHHASAAGQVSTRPTASPRDQELVDGVSTRALVDFRTYFYSPAFIASNAALFLDHEWIEIPALRDFLLTRPTNVKIEPQTLAAFSIKAEPLPTSLRTVPSPVQLRTLQENGHDVFELIDSDSDVEARHFTYFPSSRLGTDFDGQLDRDDFSDGPSDFDRKNIDSDHSDIDSVNEHGDDDDDLAPSDTLRQDKVTSFVRTGSFAITQKIRVRRIEYISEDSDLPSVWPIPRIPTVFVLDGEDEKYRINNPETGDLLGLDRIIRDADNDAWTSVPGSGDSTAKVRFAPGEPPIECRRARSTCRGMFTCANIDPALLQSVRATRFELDPTARTEVLAAEAETRRSERTTPEQHASIKFMSIIRSSTCTAVDSNQKKCGGGPILKAKPQGSSRNHQYFVACSGWRPNFKELHRTHQIPDHVDENILARFLAGQSIADGDEKDTKPCSKFVSPRTGFHQRFCPHSHIKNGQSVRSRIEQHKCLAKRAIYIPVDTSIRKALIVNNQTGHNHPMPTLTKVSLKTKETYKKLIKAAGVVGATVSKVDNAASTKVILGGKSVTGFAPALHSTRVKRDMVREVKKEKYPSGLGIAGALELYAYHLTKPLPDRYMHSYITTPGGGICIITFVPALLKFLDDPGVTSFDGDTTYKRIDGKMNEWELTAFLKIVLRIASIVRAYINRASTDFFVVFFDELQRVKLEVTGKPIAFKKLVPGGNLLVMNSDMDAAQILGFTTSAMKLNVPEHSHIPMDTPPQKVAPEIVKICWRHAKEPVLDFKSLVSAADSASRTSSTSTRRRASTNSPLSSITSASKRFTANWWRHKEMHEWIIPSLVKSQSPLGADIWDSTPSTTNANEAQHAWTNAQTGIKLTLVEGLESARAVDERVAEEIEVSLRTGIFANHNNEVVHREARNNKRRTTAARKGRESQVAVDVSAELRAQLATEQDARRESNARTKELNAQLKTVTGTSGRTKKSPGELTASSSGRVKTIVPRPGRTSSRATVSDGVAASYPSPPVVVVVDEVAATVADDPHPVVGIDEPENMGEARPPSPNLPAGLSSFPEMLPAHTAQELWHMSEEDVLLFSTMFSAGVPEVNFGTEVDFGTVFDPLPFSADPTLGNTMFDVTTHSSYGVPGFDFTPPSSTPHISTDFLTVPGPVASAYADWPRLPPIPPYSPPQLDAAHPVASTSSDDTNKKRRHRQEVDTADILKPDSVRSRNPSARARGDEEPAVKKAKPSTACKYLQSVAL
ncbi:hypothetical protein C8R46DRAFT_1343986 [Mycena filopes]|nr:hypothetical protein C8R46DRAFT_1343986 [Mycena filopes]